MISIILIAYDERAKLYRHLHLVVSNQINYLFIRYARDKPFSVQTIKKMPWPSDQESKALRNLFFHSQKLALLILINFAFHSQKLSLFI